jgi:hypothetical protein
MDEPDTLHPEDPTRVTRGMRNEPIKLGFKIGRGYVHKSMRVMRLQRVIVAHIN